MPLMMPLMMCPGMYRAIRMCVETLIQIAAARPRDAKMNIIVNQPPLFQQFKHGNAVFNLPFFSSPQFMDVVQQVSILEQQEIDSTATNLLPQEVSFANLVASMASPLAKKLAAALHSKSDFICQHCGHTNPGAHHAMNPKTHHSQPLWHTTWETWETSWHTTWETS